MRLPDKVKKLEKICYKGGDQPILLNPYLVIYEDEEGIHGLLWASNKYNALSLPVELDDGDVQGVVPLDAIAAATKNKKPILLQAEYAVVPDIAAFPRMSHLTQFPDVRKLLVDRSDTTVEVSIDTKALHDLAQSMGADIVRLRIDSSKPLQLGVEPEGWANTGVHGARGFMMPFRRPEV